LTIDIGYVIIFLEDKMARKYLIGLFLVLFCNIIAFSQNYVEYMGLSKEGLEEKLGSTLVHFRDDVYNYFIVPGNTSPTNFITIYINSIRGVYQIVVHEEYNNSWIRNKVDELSKIYGEPGVRDDMYAFRSSVNENILIIVTSGIASNRIYGIIITMILE
jgi:hypothetical protein